MSPAIVPEAFLLPGTQFRAVRVLTTASVQESDVGFVQQWFAAHAPVVPLSISRVKDFHDFTSELDHFRFEEVLYRWVLESGTLPDGRFFCLSGGFKTMSAAMQKAAAVLGAAEVFHVLADNCCAEPDGKKRPPQTAEEILCARDAGHLHWIRLGRESGWPQLRAASPQEYPLEVVNEAEGVRWIRARDHAFREWLRNIVERSQCIAGAWERLPELPFTELATWSEADLTWLSGPLEPGSAADRDWVASLPKVELHCHLGGFATSGELLEQIRAAAERPETLLPVESIALPSGWPLPLESIDLEHYRRLGNNNGSAILRDPGCLRRQCELLYAHLIEQRVCYAEIRCSPANYADSVRARSPWMVLSDIKAAFDALMKSAAQADGSDPSSAPPCRVNLLLIGTRQASGDYRAGIARHLALAVTAAEHWTSEKECRVVGVDLAGYEDQETRAHYFREEFTGVHRCGLALTVHAGENDDAEGIWRAVFDLNARRLGHALSLAQSPELLRSVADRGIGLEMCPYANLQIRGFALDETAGREVPQRRYPLLDYLRAGARVTINTDNIGISAATLTDNLLLTTRLCPGLTRLDLLRLQRHALDAAFVPASQRTELVRQFAIAIPKP
jgi:adenosine deaminase